MRSSVPPRRDYATLPALLCCNSRAIYLLRRLAADMMTVTIIDFLEMIDIRTSAIGSFGPTGV
jgi:hypothetical protein